MTNKRKQLARHLAAKIGISYQGAINQLNKGSQTSKIPSTSVGNSHENITAQGLQTEKLFTWIFALTSHSFPICGAIKSSILIPELKITFQSPFQNISGVPQDLCWDLVQVHMRFENEDGSCWGMEHDYIAKGSIFFQIREHQHQPTFVVDRVWKLLRNQIYHQLIDEISGAEINFDTVFQAREKWFQVGMFEKFGYPVRLIITLEQLKNT